MPVEFLTDDAAAYGRYAGSPSQADLERVFFLDDEDMDLVNQRRGDHMKVGFALQLVTVRWLGTFLDDPLDVPASVLEWLRNEAAVAAQGREPRTLSVDKDERQLVLALQQRTGADELMLTTMVHDHADRLRSFELVAEALTSRVSRVA